MSGRSKPVSGTTGSPEFDQEMLLNLALFDLALHLKTIDYESYYPITLLGLFTMSQCKEA